MLDTNRPLEEKMALFWHGHFATAESKVRDYRKMLLQIDTFERHAAGNFGDLLIAVAQDPAMLYYLDAGVNVKGASNENFAREVMELFTMGVGNYTEPDIREAARAFTGWNFENLDFVVHPALHDDEPKTFLGRTGNFDGVDVLRIILEQPVTAEYIAAKIYRFFVRDELSPALQRELGAILRDNDYELRPLLSTMFRSRDFLQRGELRRPTSRGPVEHVVTLLKHLGAGRRARRARLQPHHHRPRPAPAEPAVGRGVGAGPGVDHPRPHPGAGATSPSTTCFPDIVSFRDPNFLSRRGTGQVGDRLRRGYDFGSAITLDDPANMSAFDLTALERDELFNTRVSTYRGWERAVRKLIPTPRGGARVDMTRMIRDAGAATTGEAVDYLLGRFLRVPIAPSSRDALVALLDDELGTSDIGRAETYMEDPLRMMAHLIMSTPEYQIN